MSASLAGDSDAGLRPSVRAISAVGTAESAPVISAIPRRYSRSAGVARSYRYPKNPTASSASASGAATRTSAAVTGERGA